MSENKISLYFNMVLGTIGTLLLALSAMRYLAEEDYLIGLPMILFGLTLTTGYIHYLETKAGIRTKLTWIRVIAFLVLFLPLSYFLYF